MTKVTAAIIQKDEKILLMRRANGQPHAGKWEFPGGKVEPNEKLAQCMKRELQEELGIDAKVGNILASVKTQNYEIFAYNILDFTGQIKLNVHDALQWVNIWDFDQYNMMAADKQIVKKVFYYANIPNLDTDARTFASEKVKTPNFNNAMQLWRVSFIENDEQKIKHFISHNEALKFYIERIHSLIQAFKRNKVIDKINSLCK